MINAWANLEWKTHGARDVDETFYPPVFLRLSQACQARGGSKKWPGSKGNPLD
jgi:hypothetical protein